MSNPADFADGDVYDPSLADKLKVIRLESKKRPPDGLESARASTYKMRAVRWLWPGRFAIGKLGLIGGMPDMGKGLICCDIIACITAPRDFPCNEGRPQRANVVWFTAEDDIEDTVIPRLVAAGANLDRVHIVKMMRDGDKRRMFNLVTDLQALREKIEKTGDVALVIIDPMSSYVGVGKINTSSTADVRGFLTPLTDLAAELQISVIGIMHFNKKADVTSAMLRIADSLAYVAAARHVYVTVDDPNVQGRKLFVRAKNNLAPDKAALSYGIGVNPQVGQDAGKDIEAPYIVWGSELVSVTANEAMQAAAGGGASANAMREAVEFLQDRLSGGRQVKTNEIEEEAQAHGISRATLLRARRKLGVKAEKERGKINGDWHLHIPTATREHEQNREDDQ
jgi:hypothetical protein